MKTERELFQDFCEKNFDFERHEQTYFDEQTQCYENDIGECTESINMAWAAWCASAQRDGYKLVPVIDKNICDHIWHGKSENQYCGKCGEYD